MKLRVVNSVSSTRVITRYRDGSHGGETADVNDSEEEAPLTPPDSLSWQIFKNPIAMFIGGVAAVLLELAEPRVRTGIWDHTTFRTDPLRRMRRTGVAAMVTVYGPRSKARKMIAAIRQMHERIRGVTPAGQAYHANDPVLLNWVHVTASFGFLEAYNAFVRSLAKTERDQFYAEGVEAAALYGALDTPLNEAQRIVQFETMLPLLEPSPIIFEFLDILEKTRIIPFPFGFLQRILIRAAIDILPQEIRIRLELGTDYDLTGRERAFVGWLGRRADGLRIPREAARPS